MQEHRKLDVKSEQHKLDDHKLGYPQVQVQHKLDVTSTLACKSILSARDTYAHKGAQTWTIRMHNIMRGTRHTPGVRDDNNGIQTLTNVDNPNAGEISGQ